VLRDAINERWAAESDAIVQRLSAAFTEALDESVRFGTANQNLYANYVEQQIMPNNMVESVIEAIAPEGYYRVDRQNDEEELRTTVTSLRNALICMREKAAADNHHDLLHQHIAKRTLHAVKAAWRVEKKTVSSRPPPPSLTYKCNFLCSRAC
jgi:hypothetical protein